MANSAIRQVVDPVVPPSFWGFVFLTAADKVTAWQEFLEQCPTTQVVREFLELLIEAKKTGSAFRKFLESGFNYLIKGDQNKEDFVFILETKSSSVEQREQAATLLLEKYSPLTRELVLIVGTTQHTALRAWEEIRRRELSQTGWDKGLSRQNLEWLSGIRTDTQNDPIAREVHFRQLGV